MPLFYGTGLSEFEDNSTELFNRVTVKECNTAFTPNLKVVRNKKIENFNS